MVMNFLYIQGGAVNRGLKCIFSMYKPSCLIEAYVRPEKYRQTGYYRQLTLISSAIEQIFEELYLVYF